jgi:hypothetical protein
MRKSLFLLFVAVAAIIVAGAFMWSHGDDDGHDDEVGGGPGNWKVGDYWQYTQTETGVGSYAGLDRTIYIERYEVVQSNQTNITIAMERETFTYSSGEVESDVQTANYIFPANWTFWGLDYYELIRSSSSVESVGSVSLETHWGARMAEHYRDYDEGSTDTSYYHQDWWFVNGIMVLQTSKMTTTGLENEITRTISLETNFPQIVLS